MNGFSPAFVLRSQRVVLQDVIKPAALLIDQGRIAQILPFDKIPISCRIEDVGESVIMPGLVDTHVHINEPGRTSWEGFETATQAAAAGGITTLVDMPLNSSPVTTTPAALSLKIAAAAGKLWVDCGFLGGLVPGNDREMAPLLDAGVVGIKAFLVHSGIDEFPNATEKDLRAAMPILAERDAVLMAHAEVDTLHAAPPMKNPRRYAEYLATRPRVWEEDAIGLMLRLGHEFGCRVHIVHLSDADAIPALKKAKTDGVSVTVETCPHYLVFDAAGIPDGDTRFKCAPPIRETENRERLWKGLRDGTIDMVVSDHSPCPPEMKGLDSGDFKKAWGGISSLQLGLSIVWTSARERGFDPTHVSRWMSSTPAELVGLDAKGRIAPGADADLVVWNPDVPFTVLPEKLYHRHKLTPYAGRKLYGVVERTYLRGVLVAENGTVKSGARGEVLKRS